MKIRLQCGGLARINTYLFAIGLYSMELKTTLPLTMLVKISCVATRNEARGIALPSLPGQEALSILMTIF